MPGPLVAIEHASRSVREIHASSGAFQLANMAKLAKAAAGEEEPVALVDHGYYEGYEILQ